MIAFWGFEPWWVFPIWSLGLIGWIVLPVFVWRLGK